MKKTNFQFFRAVFLQFSGIVGSGIFILPYLFVRSNYLFSTIFLVFLTLITAAINRFYLDIILQTKGDHQLGGYAEIYLGPKFKKLAVFNLFLLAIGAFIAYSKLFSSFLPLIFPFLTPTISSFIFLFLIIFSFILVTSFSFPISNFLPFLMILLPVFLFAFCLNSSFDIGHLSLAVSPSFLFYGGTLFSLSGFTIIPEVEELLRGHRQIKFLLPLASFLGLILAAVIYFLFTYSVATLSGSSISVNTVSGLSAYPLIATIVAVFGLFCTINASAHFLTIVRETFYRDLKIKQLTANVLTIIFPIVCLLVGRLVSLVSVISITGEITIFISALIICLIRLKIKTDFPALFFSILVLLSLTFGLIGNLF